MSRYRYLLAVIVAGAVALVPGLAQAHVSLHPNVVPAEANVVLTLRVPNESDSASTDRVDVRFPPGFLDVAVETPPGWSVHTVTENLAKPVETDEGTITEQVREISLRGGTIEPERFAQFAFATAVPDEAGKALTFKTVQHYTDGDVERWVDPPESESPAPTVDVTESGGLIADVAGDEAGPPAGITAIPVTGVGGENEPARVVERNTGASKGLGIAALAVALVALLIAIAAAARRRSAK